MVREGRLGIVLKQPVLRPAEGSLPPLLPQQPCFDIWLPPILLAYEIVWM